MPPKRHTNPPAPAVRPDPVAARAEYDAACRKAARLYRPESKSPEWCAAIAVADLAWKRWHDARRG